MKKLTTERPVAGVLPSQMVWNRSPPGRSVTHLVSFAEGEVHVSNQNTLAWSSRGMGVDVVHSYGPSDLDPAFVARNRQILTQPQGSGYWLWKPYVIGRVLDTEAHEDDIVVYVDSGASIRSHLQPLIDLARERDLVLFENDHINRYKMSPRMLHAFGVETEQEQERWLSQKQLNAAFLVMRNTPETRNFIRTWLEHCEDPVKLVGDEQDPITIEHRHDQAILSYLAHSTPQIPKFIYPDESDLPVVNRHFFHQHRRRTL